MRKSRAEYSRQRRLEHPGEAAAATKRWRERHLEKSRELARSRSRHDAMRLKLDLIEAYGGKCNCDGCKEDRPQFMTLDHMKPGEGKEHRLKFRTSRRIYQHLKNLGWPKDNYQLLCFNCNIATHMYGVCPHFLEIAAR